MGLSVQRVQRTGGRPHGYDRLTVIRLVRDTEGGEEVIPLLAVVRLTSPGGNPPLIVRDRARVQVVRREGAYVMVWTVL